jgi:uncharacterized sulfatase
MKAFMFVVLTVGVGLCAAAEEKGKGAAGKMNVLLIYVDDLNNRLGCYGDPVVKTPNIDRLSSMGVRFERAYCQYPLCNPSRTAMLSGRYPLTTKVYGNTTPPRQYLGDIAFLPEYFHQQGYFTAKAGKIPHGTFDYQIKWDITDGPTAEGGGGGKKGKGKGKGKKAAAEGCAEEQAQEPAPAAKGRKGKKKAAAQPLDEDDLPASVAWKALDADDEDTVDGQSARTVVKYIEEHHDKPFFIACGFHKPHRPYQAPKKYFANYPSESTQMALQPPNGREGVPHMAFTWIAEDAKLSDKQQKDAIAAYHACITFMDAQTGLLLDAMDPLKLWDNTVVVFLSDHGYHLGEHVKLWRKMTLFEEAARVPFIMVVPGMKGGVCPRTVETLSIYPTLIELCGLPKNDGLEGVSIVPLLKEPTMAWDRPAYTVVGRGGEGMGWSLRTERWRYAEWGEKREAELYDLISDPHEFANLANDPKHAEVVKEMSEKLRGKWPGRSTGEKSRGGGGD